MADIVDRLTNMTRDGYRYCDHHDGDAVHCAIQDAGKEITTLRDRIAKLEKALEPFADAVYNDNGDIEVNLSVDADDLINAYFVLRRAALDQDKGCGDG